MRSRRFRASADEFEALPRKPGWSYEHSRGVVRIRPKHNVVVASIDASSITPPIDVDLTTRTVTRDDLPFLVDLFTAAFGDTAEYCDVEPDAVRLSAHESLRGYFDGARGKPLDLSLVVVADSAVLRGAALVVRKPAGVVLDLLMIRPEHHRLGIASSLVAGIARRLTALGDTRLFSCYRIANEESTAWHRRFGFVDEPDLHLAIEKRDHFARELRRRLRSGLLSDEEKTRLETECFHWQREVASLEDIARRDGREAVAPFLRLRRV